MYLTQIYAILLGFFDARSELADQLRTGAANLHGSKFDDLWVARTFETLNELSKIADRLKNVHSVPTAGRDIQGDVVQLAGLIEDAVSQLKRGIEDVDAQCITSGAESAEKWDGIMDSITDKVSDFCR